MYIYREDQQDIHDRIFHAWDNGQDNVLAVSGVGTGKTVITSNVVRELVNRNPGKQVIVIAHRQELVSQLSLALAENGLDHSLICGRVTQKFITKRHVKKFKRSFVKYKNPVVVASVGTLINDKTIDPLNVAGWVIDEAHHVLRDNQWGKCVTRYRNAKGLGVTATPCRADGKGLGAHADGLFQALIENKKRMGQLIVEGTLSRFMIYAPPSNLQIGEEDITASGDYSGKKLSVATKHSNIIHGDVVNSYLKYAPGKLGITFVPDIDIGEIITQQFNDRGVPAALITAKTPDAKRAELLDKFEAKEILQLVNVDIFGEGFNLPAVEVVQFARKTASYGLYVQQFGRALRTAPGKSHAIIIDHVGNVAYHGLPTQNKEWTLDRRERNRKGEVDPDKIKLKTCLECMGVYEAFNTNCPYCGYEHKPQGRQAPDMVDGDLALVDFSHLDELHAEIANIQRELTDRDLPRRAGPVACKAVMKNHRERKEAIEELRLTMAHWSGARMLNYTLRERQKLFYLRFGVDVLTAQTMKKKEANELIERIKNDTPLQ